MVQTAICNITEYASHTPDTTPNVCLSVMVPQEVFISSMCCHCRPFCSSVRVEAFNIISCWNPLQGHKQCRFRFSALKSSTCYQIIFDKILSCRIMCTLQWFQCFLSFFFFFFCLPLFLSLCFPMTPETVLLPYQGRSINAAVWGSTKRHFQLNYIFQ